MLGNKLKILYPRIKINKDETVSELYMHTRTQSSEPRPKRLYIRILVQATKKIVWNQNASKSLS